VNEDVADAIKAWLPAFGLPAEPVDRVKDLRGRSVRVAKFVDEVPVRFFFPRRTLLFQQKMVKGLTRHLRGRGAKIDSVRLSIEDYARWLDLSHETDTAELRFHFATCPPEF